eukprot:2209045-Pyramimonas_sp.AAC.1
MQALDVPSPQQGALWRAFSPPPQKASRALRLRQMRVTIYISPLIRAARMETGSGGTSTNSLLRRTRTGR